MIAELENNNADNNENNNNGDGVDNDGDAYDDNNNNNYIDNKRLPHSIGGYGGVHLLFTFGYPKSRIWVKF